ncbi:hypothetical protein F7725_020928 [Dissostichus mawsoni]|uniref:Uncharacterized protein n=1 Tax=Dissostichus mawsoni TaxID=36200 RepID=A0A7J5YEQ0_DISMA|nr:hypothetical protein F7725_020928 [Dissostichus mawsoni]
MNARTIKGKNNESAGLSCAIEPDLKPKKGGGGGVLAATAAETSACSGMICCGTAGEETTCDNGCWMSVQKMLALDRLIPGPTCDPHPH